MEILFWVVVFVVTLALLIKGAGLFLESAEEIGLAMGFSSFVIGVIIVGVGTSLPELVSSLFAVWSGAPEIVVANAVGSNIANILFIVGLSAIIGGRLAVTKNLIDLDIPLLAVTTGLGVVMMWDGVVTFVESLFLLLGFIVFLLYSVRGGSGNTDTAEVRQLFSWFAPKAIEVQGFNDASQNEKSRVDVWDFIWIVVGLFALVIGAKYLVVSVIQLATLLSVGAGAITLFAVALGTSLPELAVSIKAAIAGKHDVALGNIFGSNIFNILFVVGVPGLFSTLPIDQSTLLWGVPMLIIATTFFVISSISRRVHSYEGALYVLLYVFFVGRLFSAW